MELKETFKKLDSQLKQIGFKPDISNGFNNFYKTAKKSCKLKFYASLCFNDFDDSIELKFAVHLALDGYSLSLANGFISVDPTKQVDDSFCMKTFKDVAEKAYAFLLSPAESLASTMMTGVI